MSINLTKHECLPNAIVALATYLRKKYGPDVCIIPSATSVSVEFTGGGSNGSDRILYFAITADAPPFDPLQSNVRTLGSLPISIDETGRGDFSQMDVLLDHHDRQAGTTDAGAGSRVEKYA